MEYKELVEEINAARQNAEKWIYEVGQVTPVEELAVGSGHILLKREDISPINSYKWRGAYTKVKWCVEQGNRGPFVATSAGNHAQGVALAANRLGVEATIFMPRSTPKLKQASVRRLGQDNVAIELVGDNFEQALAASDQFADQKGMTRIKPFDDVQVIAGQSMVADELVSQTNGLDVVYVPIGGGGLASGVGLAMGALSSGTTVVGVEVIGQESMRQSISSARICPLDDVDIFCDGTAVKQPGNLTFEICRQTLDRIVLVTNEQVCAAIQKLWEEKRVITEPSGGIALAGLCQDLEEGVICSAKQKCCAVISGSNTDFLTLPLIVKRSQLAQPSRCYYRFEIEERGGSLIELLDLLFEDINIVDFQYGKIGTEKAFPVLGLYASPEELKAMRAQIAKNAISAMDVSRHQSSEFRVIPFQPDLVKNATFLHVDFPDRPGALRELMREISAFTNICYFNFNDTGQLEGHALIGFEFENESNRTRFEETMASLSFHFRRADMAMVFE